METTLYAFPVVTDYCPVKGVRSEPGMELRDYFAGQALTQFCRHGIERRIHKEVGPGDVVRSEWDVIEEKLLEGGYAGTIAEKCYELADAMLAARDAGKDAD